MMAKKKTLDELKEKEQQLQVKLEQAEHQLTLKKNQVDYLKNRNRKQRTHRLITKGAAFESKFPGTDRLSEMEFLRVMDEMEKIPTNKNIILRALRVHDELEKFREKE